jgi:hypothetical protein
MGTLRDITASVLALSSVLMEVDQLQSETQDPDLRDTLEECEITLLDGITYHAAKVARHTAEQKEA